MSKIGLTAKLGTIAVLGLIGYHFVYKGAPEPWKLPLGLAGAAAIIYGVGKTLRDENRSKNNNEQIRNIQPYPGNQIREGDTNIRVDSRTDYHFTDRSDRRTIIIQNHQDTPRRQEPPQNRGYIDI